jgi:hypothetical protein
VGKSHVDDGQDQRAAEYDLKIATAILSTAVFWQLLVGSNRHIDGRYCLLSCNGGTVRFTRQRLRASRHDGDGAQPYSLFCY